ncbi:MAG: polysaccharide deacetylase family protein [Candidatus Korobacteraceae bacterium]
MLALAIEAVAVAGVATWAGFQTMWPTSQVYGRTFIGLKPGSRRLALTYDDGPNDPHTFRMLEVLERHGAKATFFLIGRFVQERPDIARAVVAAGHAVGIHTWDHPNLIFVPASEVWRQLKRTQQAIQDATGVEAKLFRPPFGGRRPASLRVARACGLETVMWNVTCYDWKAISADEIVQHAERQIRGGDVILLHDGEYHRIGMDRSRSVEASERILARYESEGYEFVTIPEMMKSWQLAIGN